jgi:DNA-binding NarL/FixJ family response regulator
MTKVLIVSDQSIFGQGLEGLLRREQGIDLVDQVASPDALPGCLEQCRPDVVFFGCSDPASCSAPVFIQALRDGLVRRIICVNLEDNAVYVFRGERHAVEKVEDLVEAITGQIPGALP